MGGLIVGQPQKRVVHLKIKIKSALTFFQNVGLVLKIQKGKKNQVNNTDLSLSLSLMPLHSTCRIDIRLFVYSSCVYHVWLSRWDPGPPSEFVQTGSYRPAASLAHHIQCTLHILKFLLFSKGLTPRQFRYNKKTMARCCCCCCFGTSILMSREFTMDI